MISWNTEQFFDRCLKHFSEIPGIIVHEGTDLDGQLMLRLLARVGFSSCCNIEQWSPDVDAFLKRIADRDFTPESMAWFEDAAKAVVLFACYAYGALAGKYSAGEINHDEFELGVFHLPGYYFLKNDEIEDAYNHGIGSA